LLETLRPFPDAARAVGAALHRLETEAAARITAKAARRVSGGADSEPPERNALVIEHEHHTSDGNGRDDAREVEP
jgi:hypothetical protein